MAEELALESDEARVGAAIEESTTNRRARRRAAWWAEIKGIFWLVLAVLGFHSFIAKPFYIPSESMLPGLLVGDRLVVSKYPYGYSFVSPTFHMMPFMKGRLFGSLPARGDVVIVTPPGTRTDYIKRIIGLPGDRLEVRGGQVILNGVPVKRGPLHYVDIPDYGGVRMHDGSFTCDPVQYPGARRIAPDGSISCRLPLVTETLPDGRSYETVDLDPGYSEGDNYGPITVPANNVFLMGDNRDRSADSRFSLAELGLGGPVPWEYVGGRAEFITFSLDGSATLNPLTWWGAFRGGRSGDSLHPARAAR
ncbi:signal peptidase I [Hephaestia sp. GCM10023244]|uniref:signal peptidase I n=1 Tax=unclassified Hephaestia TaxID=2631281 RepID=UPI0020776C4F|nr:signal peptidase I [Hephaestia sp. MAHUQ-44]MCM8730496.1 signal peptidase I [Hephaestia sp. MAHUQ-44]